MNYYNEIKTELLNNEIYKKAKDYSKNKSDLETYYNVGKLLIEAQGGEEKWSPLETELTWNYYVDLLF